MNRRAKIGLAIVAVLACGGLALGIATSIDVDGDSDGDEVNGAGLAQTHVTALHTATAVNTTAIVQHH